MIEESSTYLIVDENNVVVNRIVYDGIAEFSPGDGFTLKEHPKNEDGSLSYLLLGATINDDGSFVNPEPPSTDVE